MGRKSLSVRRSAINIALKTCADFALEGTTEICERRNEVLDLVEYDRAAVSKLLIEARRIDIAGRKRVFLGADLTRGVRDERLRMNERLRGDHMIEGAEAQEVRV